MKRVFVLRGARTDCGKGDGFCSYVTEAQIKEHLRKNKYQYRGNFRTVEEVVEGYYKRDGIFLFEGKLYNSSERIWKLYKENLPLSVSAYMKDSVLLIVADECVGLIETKDVLSTEHPLYLFNKAGMQLTIMNF